MPIERDAVDSAVLVGAQPELALPELVAIGLLVSRKWDRTLSAFGDLATSSDALAYDSFTASEMLEFRANARRMLGDYVSNTARPSEPFFGRAFWQG